MEQGVVGSSSSEGEQFIMYEGDGVEVLFKDGGRLQLSPCGSIFVYQQMSPLSCGTPVQQKTQFATSLYRQQVKEALDFRNRFAKLPYVCRELVEPESIIRSHLHICECSWPTSVENGDISVLNDGSLKLLSPTKVGTESVALMWLSATRRTFIVHYLVELELSRNGRQSNTHHSSNLSECLREANSSISSNIPKHVSSLSSIENLRRVINFDGSDKQQTLVDDSKYRCTHNAGESTVDSTCSPSIEYAWISQHFSTSSYPSCWQHPVELLLQFSKSSSCKAHLNKLQLSREESGTSKSSVEISAIESNVERSASKSSFVHSSLPTLMSSRCLSPHLHRWNPSASDDVCDYFHDKVKIVAIKGTVYRLLWDCNPRMIEVYPPDGSIIQSTGGSGHHFTHIFLCERSKQIEERTYSSQSPPPLSTDLKYPVTRLVVMAHRLLKIMSDKYMDLTTNRPVCWQVTTHRVFSTSTMISSNHVIDQCHVQGVGRFTAYLDGSIHIVFDDRTCLDMHVLSWESHVYQKVLHSLSSDDDLEAFISNVRKNRRIVDFPDDVCRLLLPSGHYQHVDILQPHLLYERYVSCAMEYAMWVNTPLRQRETFYCDSLTQQKHVADAELHKIRTFTYILDQALGSTSISANTSALPLSAGGRQAAALNIAQQALNENAAMLKDLDSFITANERHT